MPIDDRQSQIDAILAQMEQTNMGQQPLAEPNMFGKIATGLGSVLKNSANPIADQQALRDYIQKPQIAANAARKEGLAAKLKVAEARKKNSLEEQLKVVDSPESRRLQDSYEKMISGTLQNVPGIDASKLNFSHLRAIPGDELSQITPKDAAKMIIEASGDVQKNKAAAAKSGAHSENVTEKRVDDSVKFLTGQTRTSTQLIRRISVLHWRKTGFALFSKLKTDKLLGIPKLRPN
jgi:hypothetical protein